MDNKLLVSVVIPCYNHGSYLQEALDSIESSTYPHLEVIVVDDGSTDPHTQTCLHALENATVKGRAIQILHQDNAGPAAARNNGIRAATGELILPLDADDKIVATYIEKCVWVLTKHPDVGFVYPSVQHFGVRSDVWHARNYEYQALLFDNYVVVSSMIRKSLWESTGGFDETLPGYEDWDFWIRAGNQGHRGYWLPEPLFVYRKQKESRLVTDNERRHRLVRIIRDKNREIYQKHARSNWRSKLQAWRWKAFSAYARTAAKVPARLKEPLKSYIKPVVKKVFLPSEQRQNVLHQPQVLEPTDFDAYVKNVYAYRPNRAYEETVNGDSAKQEGSMSILFIAPWLVVGGADKVNLDLIEQFHKAGYRLHVFTTLQHEHPWHFRFYELTHRITHLGNWFDEADEMLDYVLDYVRTHQIDIIQLSNSQIGYQIAELIRTHCPAVRIVDLIHMEEPYYPFDFFRYSVRYKEHLDHRVVITPYLKQVMIEKYGETDDRVTVIPNGIKVPATYEQTGYGRKLDREHFTVGFIGRMEEQKQPHDVVRTAKNLLEKTTNVRVLLVGDGSLLSSAQELTRKLDLEGDVEFLGGRNDAVRVMQEEFDVFFAPSLREGLPIVGLEALSLGVPIVATAVPGWHELVADRGTGFLLQPGDCEGFADACLRLMQDRVLRQSLSLQAYQLAESQYAIEKTARIYLDIYRLLLQKS